MQITKNYRNKIQEVKLNHYQASLKKIVRSHVGSLTVPQLVKTRLADIVILIVDNVIRRATENTRRSILFDDDCIIINKEFYRVDTINNVE